MEVVSKFVKTTLPNYLKSLPIPKSLGGFADLSGSDWVALLPFVGIVAYITYLSITALLGPSQPTKQPQKDKNEAVNLKIQKECPKVVNVVDLEELGDKTCYCRCWRSKKFPLCDGSHNAHNEETGDNVGPVVMKRNK
ncbi:PREDICTED: CDGSH iron-sulfur domain-containing protein 2 homolog A-like [Priapulus caudatus]|uniref:CDGSH iron-sulfur domain-containing protein 2 homologue n=1 Tax=Priapulus caudatus TaxID=37621 RepID=A0ABM1F2D0_PRICU|nr:PREDICTED: CDGSH iron-sulfur domain-containing protein 2 homolog A-like [Priapulus caudatus]